MSEAPCQHPDCNLTVELPDDPPIAKVSGERMPPRQIELVCPLGHRSVYTLPG